MPCPSWYPPIRAARYLKGAIRLTELMGFHNPDNLSALQRHYLTSWCVMAERAEVSVHNDRSQPGGENAHLVAGGKLLGRNASPEPVAPTPDADATHDD